jgi:formylmethanofuran dehydrogenase subunit C
MLRLTQSSTTTIPIEAECITPDGLAGKTTAEIAALPVQHGNAAAPLGDFFHIEGDASDQQVVLRGDCSRVKWAGAGMISGQLTVESDIGMHVGSEMRGGTIDVKGSAGDWVGAEMRGGTLRVRGNAGHLVGAGYRGSRLGMRGGVILVDGKAGNEIGSGLRRGFIVVGDAADFVGVSMIAGTIFVVRTTGVRTGAGMQRGTIAVLGTPPQLLPTFRRACVYQPVFLQVYFRYLRQAGYPIADEFLRASYRRFIGDLVATGKGEILTPE